MTCCIGLLRNHHETLLLTCNLGAMASMCSVSTVKRWVNDGWLASICSVPTVGRCVSVICQSGCCCLFCVVVLLLSYRTRWTVQLSTVLVVV